MGRYPREVRAARMKCIDCNAPVVETVDGSYACVSCGRSPISTGDEIAGERPSPPSASAAPGTDGSPSASNGN